MANPIPPKSANSAQPSKLSNPVPTKGLEDAAAAFMAQQKAIEVPLPPEPKNEEYQPVDVQPEEVEEPGVLNKTLDAAGRVLDYAGGASRAGLANVAGMAQDIAQGKNPLNEPPIVTEEDLLNVAKGKGPDTAEYLRRLGVPEGGSVNIGGVKFTTRGAAGLAGDIATDPLTAIAKMIKLSPYLRNIIGSPGKASEALGEAVYKSALPKAAQDAAGALIESGAPIGGTAKLAQKIDDLSNTMGKIRQGLYDRATSKGVVIDSAYPLKRAEAALSAMNKDPGLAPVVQDLQSLLDRYKSAGKVPIDIVSEWKTNLYDSLPANAFNGPKLKNKAKAFKAALAADFREAIAQAGNKAEKGLGDSINALNEKWGTLLSAKQPLEKATKASGGKLGMMIDGAVLAGGGVGGIAAKKGFDIATSPFAKTVVGRALMEAGKRDLVDRLTRQALSGQTRQKPIPLADEEIQE